MKDYSIVKKLIDTKNYLIANTIYTTPTFIVNKKIVNQPYAIYYLEDIIQEELLRK